jgi:hypothetical protein
MNNKKLVGMAAIHALGTLIYVFLVTAIMNNGEKLFGSEDNEMLMPVVFLLLFVFSALITSFLVLGKPLMLYLDGQKKEGVKMLFYTGGFLLAIIVIVGTILAIIK